MNFEWTGSLPDVNQELDFSEEMEQAAEYTYQSVMKNFAEGGRPVRWPGLKSGGQSFLNKTGALKSSIERVSDKNSFKVWTSIGKIRYALIHHFGGVIQHPGSKKFQAWPGENGYVYAHGTKPHPIPIPERPYMLFQKEDEKYLHKLVKDRILTLFTTKRKPVGTQS